MKGFFWLGALALLFFASGGECQLEGRPIIKHLRYKGGIPFTKPATSVAYTDEDSFRAAFENFQAKLNEPLARLKERKPLPNCPKDTVTVSPAGEEVIKTFKDLSSDILFVRSARPKDPDELFGEKTKLVICTDQPSDDCSVLGPEFEVYCTPTRVRLLEGEIQHMEGKPALLNYDLAPEGEMHELVGMELKRYLGR